MEEGNRRNITTGTRQWERSGLLGRVTRPRVHRALGVGGRTEGGGGERMEGGGRRGARDGLFAPKFFVESASAEV